MHLSTFLMCCEARPGAGTKNNVLPGEFFSPTKQLIKKLIFRRRWNFRAVSASIISSDSQETAASHRPLSSGSMAHKSHEQERAI
jgi:hypothetical protein